jgi:hypothetical protein
MTPKSVNNPAPSPGAGEDPVVELRGHSYADHRQIVPALLDSVASCGCWVLEQRALSPTMTELRFEVQLRSVFELYSGLIATGLELTPDSHIRMTGLCTVRDHNPHQAKRRRIITMRLELSFLEQNGSGLNLGRSSMGLA